MIKTLAEIQSYFRHLAAICPEISEFIVGDSEVILSQDRSRLQYPVLWLETPVVNWDLSNVGERDYDLYFVVLINSPTDAWQHQQYILHRTLEITNWLLAKIRQDHHDEILKLRTNASSSPIFAYGHDHDYGYRTRLTIQAPIEHCPDCHFPDACPVGALAAFTWSNENGGDFTNLVITDASNYAETTGWTTAWTWQIDGGTVETDTDPPGPDLGAGSYMLVTLTITRGDCEKTASAIIHNPASCGDSVPYLLTKEYT